MWDNGTFVLDVGVSATAQIARFWELGFEICERAAAAEATVPAEFASSARWRSEGAVQEGDRAETTASPFNPSEVIAAAFKSAGLAQPGNRERTDVSKVDRAADADRVEAKAESRAAVVTNPEGGNASLSSVD